MKLLRGVQLLLLVASVLVLVGFKAGWLPLHPPLLAGLATLLVVTCLTDLGLALRCLVSNQGRRLGQLARSLANLALILMFAGGLANWLLSLQGFVLLSEGDAVPLHDHLQGLEAGPLADPHDLQLLLELSELELEPMPGRSFAPRSSVRVTHADGSTEILSVGGNEVAAAGSLRLHQGSFGFSPRIVVLAGDTTLADRVIPFDTERSGHGLRFSGSMLLPEHGMRVQGDIDLRGLDEQLRGHPRLQLVAWQGGRRLGGGELQLGHFADLGQGIRVGFAGLQRWSEIDVARRSYPEVIIVGMVLLPLATLLWMIGRWHERH